MHRVRSDCLVDRMEESPKRGKTELRPVRGEGAAGHVGVGPPPLYGRAFLQSMCWICDRPEYIPLM